MCVKLFFLNLSIFKTPNCTEKKQSQESEREKREKKVQQTRVLNVPDKGRVKESQREPPDAGMNE